MANPLSRSISRSQLFWYCKKKYYFSYYSYWLRNLDTGLWLEALTLKKLQSLAMWSWEMIHYLLSDYLHNLQDQTITPTKINELKEGVIKYMDKMYKISKNKNYSQYDKDNQFWLSEHFYQMNIDSEFQKAKDKVTKYLDNFLVSDLHDQVWQHILSDNKVFIEPKKSDFEAMKIQIKDIPELAWIVIFAQPDFGVILDKKSYIIYDRKSGKLPEYSGENISDQLKVYSYKVAKKLWLENVNELNIKAYEVFLQDMSTYGWPVSAEEIKNVETKILDAVREQKKYLRNEDIIKNIPIEVEKFQRTDNVNKCKSCRFRSVCEKLKSFEKEI